MVSPKRCSSLNLLTSIGRLSRRRLRCKNKKNGKNDVLGGVFHSSTTAAVQTAPTNSLLRTSPEKQDSSSSFAAADTTLSMSDASTGSSDDSQSAWVSSGSPSHHAGSPLLVRRAISKRHLGSFHLSDEEVLGRVMVSSRKLPKAKDGYIASNHVLINNERTKRTMVPLKRSREMDDIAREHASRMAQLGALFHADPANLNERLGSNRIGANVGRGSSIQDIHKHMMEKSVSDKNNITDRRFVSMGVGTAKAANGTLYLCQIFGD